MKKEFSISILIGLTFLFTGFILLHKGIIGYGVSFFVFLPFILGYLLGKSIVKSVSFYGLITSFIIFFILLICGGLEGMICVLMAMPIVIIATILGICAKRIYCKVYPEKKNKNELKSSILPFLFFLSFSFVEEKLTEKKFEISEVKSELILPFSPDEIYNSLIHLDSINSEKSFLMYLNLPIPETCELEKDEIGAIRICYSNSGKFVQEITEIEKNKMIHFNVLNLEITGRKWLGMKSNSYLIEKINKENTKITEKISYTTELYPRFYWKPLEELGFKQIQNYVLKSLEQDLKNSKNK
ncbi:hypothetical protein [Aureivirga sp. CE67]|uniref:hypothetical protein n=1 Tax=Aureivirga sp. CE67 TaxID=1788983 RepID=UPI0018C99C86|nr:hypothetical protein [Aureivirga sp. CE67]